MSHEDIKNTDQTLVDEEATDQQLQTCQLELAQYKDQYARAVADLQNYIKRADRDKALFEQSVYNIIFLDLLPIIDDFERARTNRESKDLSADDCKDQVQTWIDGFDLIAKQFDKVLARYRVHEIEQMKTFDPELHEALTRVKSDEHASGDIVQVLQKGYMIGTRVLRPAKVAVAE